MSNSNNRDYHLIPPWTESETDFETWIASLRFRAEEEARVSKREFYAECLARIDVALSETLFSHAPIARAELLGARDLFQDLLAPPKIAGSPELESHVESPAEIDSASSITTESDVNIALTEPAVQLATIEPSKLLKLQQELDSLKIGWHRISERLLEAPVRSDLFRLRAQYCRLASISICAYVLSDLSISADVDTILIQVRDFCEQTPNGSPHYLSPEAIQAISDHEVWSRLAEQLDRAAFADDAYRVVNSVISDVDDDDLKHILDRIGATQQILYRTLEVHNLSDRLQSEFYSDLRSTLARFGMYSQSLNDSTPVDQLESLASHLSSDYDRVMKRARRSIEDRERAEAKQAALDNLRSYANEKLASGEAMNGSGQHIFELVRKCREVKIPDSTLELRKVLLHFVDALPEHDKSLAKLRAYVLADRKKAGIDCDEVTVSLHDAESVEDDEDPEDDQGRLEIQRMIEALLPRTRGLRALIIGGTPRQNNRDRLKDLLEFAEVDWPGSSANDKPAKFETAIKKAQLVISLKAFSRKGHVALVRKLARGHCVVLPLNAGFGPNRVVRCMFEQMIKDDVGVRNNGLIHSAAT